MSYGRRGTGPAGSRRCEITALRGLLRAARFDPPPVAFTGVLPTFKGFYEGSRSVREVRSVYSASRGVAGVCCVCVFVDHRRRVGLSPAAAWSFTEAVSSTLCV